MRKYTTDDLYNFIEEISTCTITCSSCGKDEQTYNSDAYYDQDKFFEKGWRATVDNVYCPECAPKKLKPKTTKP